MWHLKERDEDLRGGKAKQGQGQEGGKSSIENSRTNLLHSLQGSLLSWACGRQP